MVTAKKFNVLAIDCCLAITRTRMDTSCSMVSTVGVQLIMS